MCQVLVSCGSVALNWVIFPLGTFGNAGDIFGCHDCVCTTSIWWVEVKDEAKHPSMHSPPSPHNRELSSPKYQ